MSKKITLIVLVLLTGLGSFAQTTLHVKDQLKVVRFPDQAKKIPIFQTNLEPVLPLNFSGPVQHKSSASTLAKQMGLTETIIGTTIYDLQTNGSISDRVQLVNGKLSATWTFASTSTNGWEDRGTGYNYYDGSVWQPIPSVRIESERTGFTNIVVPSNGAEVVIAHNTTSQQTQVTSRSTAGSGTWTEDLASLASSALTGNLWNKTAVSGNNIHVINLTAPVANGGATYGGQDGALMYYRSTDGGQTWDVTNYIIPEISDSVEYSRWGGDSYQIDANGNNVAIIIGDEFTDLLLLKSTDNGANWTKSIVWDMPIANYHYDELTDIDGDAIVDTILTTGGDPNVLVDNSGKAHVWFSSMRFFDDTPGDGFYSPFRGTDGLFYWNEDMITGDGVLVAQALDLDGDGYLTLTDIGTFGGGGLTIQPCPGMDENGKLYLSYASVLENTADADGKSLRHVYITWSDDGGLTWTPNPEDVAVDPIVEGVFGSIPRDIDAASGHFYVVYQRDFCAGHAAFGNTDNDPCNTGNDINDIVCVDAAPVGIFGPAIVTTNQSITLYPNPSNGQFSFALKNSYSGEATITVMNNVGQVVKTWNNFEVIRGKANLDVSELANGLYILNVNDGSGAATIPFNVFR